MQRSLLALVARHAEQSKCHGVGEQKLRSVAGMNLVLLCTCRWAVARCSSAARCWAWRLTLLWPSSSLCPTVGVPTFPPLPPLRPLCW